MDDHDCCTAARQPAGKLNARKLRFAVLVSAMLTLLSPAWAADGAKCGAKQPVLWGDGKHDDTVALNAWFRGDAVVWDATGGAVGSQIAGHVFRLSSAIYIPSGTGRRIAHFEFVWPERREVVSGGMIAAGLNPDQPPVATGLTKIGAGPNEGVPFPSEAQKPDAATDQTGCLVS